MENNIGKLFKVRSDASPIRSVYANTLCEKVDSGTYKMYDGQHQLNRSGSAVELLPIQVGDTVEYTDAIMSIHKGQLTVLSIDGLGDSDVSVKNAGGFEFYISVDTAKKIEENNMKFKVNDIIVDEDGDNRKIIAIVGTQYAASEYGDRSFVENETEAIGLYSQDDADVYGWKLADEEVKELTLQEVADKFGVDVSAVRIKE